MEMQEKLLVVDAPYFCAGVVMINNNVVYAAPILNYTKGWRSGQFFSYCKKKKWRWQEVDQYAETKIKEGAQLTRIEGRDIRTKRTGQENN